MSQALGSAKAAAPQFASAYVANVPHVRQKPDFCGEACAAMVLQKLGHKVDQDVVFDAAGIDPLLARGCHTKELAKSLAAIGFRIGSVWYTTTAERANEGLAAQFGELHADLVAGIPSIVCMRTSDTAQATEHFRLVVGYDSRTDEIIYHEPAADEGADRRLTRAEFLALWPLKYQADKWTVIRLRLEPGKISLPEATTAYTAADFAQHLMRLKLRLPSGFHVVVEPPFVVIGDDTSAEVERRAENTVRWAVKLLKKDYFARDPNTIIDIWLFKDKASYEHHTQTLFGDKPTTPFGYFSHQHRALIMNISTGGGTLVHEIVHPFMAANFAACPSWFNEGLASLYEQSGEEGGRIRGYTNWRLTRLQETIRQGRLDSFENLCHTSTTEFYSDQRGSNYAQARYLCYYLQERDLLAKYYHEFRKQADRDPSGYRTLTSVLAADDMKTFQREWEQWVLQLKR